MLRPRSLVGRSNRLFGRGWRGMEITKGGKLTIMIWGGFGLSFFIFFWGGGGGHSEEKGNGVKIILMLIVSRITYLW